MKDIDLIKTFSTDFIENSLKRIEKYNIKVTLYFPLKRELELRKRKEKLLKIKSRLK